MVCPGNSARAHCYGVDHRTAELSGERPIIGPMYLCKRQNEIRLSYPRLFRSNHRFKFGATVGVVGRIKMTVLNRLKVGYYTG
jgi:hypothetical protein